MKNKKNRVNITGKLIYLIVAVLDENRGLLAGVLSAAGGDTQRL